MEYQQMWEGTEELKQLQMQYKREIGEAAPSDDGIDRLFQAIKDGRILFFGCFDNGKLVACCSVCRTFSTFDYLPGGVFEDFYIVPDHRHRGIARKLVQFAYEESGISSLTVGCADCDVEMYKAVGFSVRLGTMLAKDE
ncbi:MAG: GNAT family N-acetyltransferase [Clostridia bacterium]|nr:GNAT family N-acetyltransferase [Clostridia bacterium]